MKARMAQWTRELVALGFLVWLGGLAGAVGGGLVDSWTLGMMHGAFGGAVFYATDLLFGRSSRRRRKTAARLGQAG